MMADRAQLLVTTALVVGPDRAVAAATARSERGARGASSVLQPAVLDRDTRRAVRDRDWDLDDLMQRATAEPAPRRRSSSSSGGSPASRSRSSRWSRSSPTG